MGMRPENLIGRNLAQVRRVTVKRWSGIYLINTDFGKRCKH